MSNPKLFMVLLGGKPRGRHTEQHDVFFGIASSLEQLIPDMKAFWPEMAEKMHVDAWRTVSRVGDHQIEVVPKIIPVKNNQTLYFINLGGYRPGEFEEYHYKMLLPAADKTIAVAQAKQLAFFQHTGYEQPHIDDKYGIDVDDLYDLEEILPASVKTQYNLSITSADPSLPADLLSIGYLPMKSI